MISLVPIRSVLVSVRRHPFFTKVASTIPLMRILRFGLSGCVATLVHVVVAVSLVEYMSASVVTANVVAFLIATIFSYTLQTQWSFGHKLSRDTFRRFVVVVIGGLLLTTALSALAETLGWPYQAGIILVIMVVPAVTYVLHSKWTYRMPRTLPDGRYD